MTAISPLRHAACRTVTSQKAALDGGHSDVVGTTGTLIASDGRDARVECGGCITDARIAFSCIVRPEPGDRVLMSVADGTIWITAIAERLAGTSMCLCAEGDVSIVSMRGDVSLMAGRSVNLDAEDRARIASPEIALHAGVARFVLDELQQIGRKASFYVNEDAFGRRPGRDLRGARADPDAAQQPVRGGKRSASRRRHRSSCGRHAADARRNHAHDGGQSRQGGRGTDPHGLNADKEAGSHVREHADDGYGYGDPRRLPDTGRTCGGRCLTQTSPWDRPRSRTR